MRMCLFLSFFLLVARGTEVFKFRVDLHVFALFSSRCSNKGGVLAGMLSTAGTLRLQLL